MKLSPTTFFATLILLCLSCSWEKAKAQLIPADGDWFLLFVDNKHIDTGRDCQLQLQRKDNGYILTHTKRKISGLPPEGFYSDTGNILFNSNAEITRERLALLFENSEGSYEFRSVRVDSIMQSYARLSGGLIDAASEDSNKIKTAIPLAISTTRKAIRIDDRCVECYYNIAICMLLLKKTDSAAYYVKKIRPINPTWKMTAVAEHAIANAYIYDAWEKYGKKGKYKQAIAMYREATKIDTENAEAWYNLGGACYTIKDYKTAETAFREAIRLKPDHEEAAQGLEAVLESKPK